MMREAEFEHIRDVMRLATAMKTAGIIPTGEIVTPPYAVGKTLPASYSTSPSKGQLSNPLRSSDVPVEVKQRLRRRTSASLARAMQDAGGLTSKEGDQYAAVLAERGINPNLAASNLQLARATPNDVYQRQKSASLCNIDDAILKMLGTAG
jgi:hypothetical protein